MIWKINDESQWLVFQRYELLRSSFIFKKTRCIEQLSRGRIFSAFVRNWETSTQNVRNNAEAYKIFKIDKQIFYLQGKFRKIMKLPRRVQDVLLLSKVAPRGWNSPLTIGLLSDFPLQLSNREYIERNFSNESYVFRSALSFDKNICQCYSYSGQFSEVDFTLWGWIVAENKNCAIRIYVFSACNLKVPQFVEFARWYLAWLVNRVFICLRLNMYIVVLLYVQEKSEIMQKRIQRAHNV